MKILDIKTSFISVLKNIKMSFSKSFLASIDAISRRQIWLILFLSWMTAPKGLQKKLVDSCKWHNSEISTKIIWSILNYVQ